MAIEHNAIPDNERHEPKGISTATANQVYFADGSGSGEWSHQKIVLNVHHDDLSSTTSHYVASPVAGNITRVDVVIDQSFTGSDTVVQVEIGGVAVTDGSVTFVQAGSAAGDVQTATPTSNNTLTAGSVISVVSDGGMTTSSCHAEISILVEVTS